MYYNRNAQGKSLQAHFIMPFLTEKAQSAVATTQTGGYINPTKLESGGSVRFALLDDQNHGLTSISDIFFGFRAVGTSPIPNTFLKS